MRISDWSSDVCSSDLPLGNVERVEPGIGIGDEVAGKSGEVALRMLALAVGAVEVGRRRRRAATVRALVAHIDPQPPGFGLAHARRSEEHTSELQSLMRISYAVFCLKKKKIKQT